MFQTGRQRKSNTALVQGFLVAGNAAHHIGQRMEQLPTAETMEHIARAVLGDLPPDFRHQLEDVVLRVEDFATAEQLQSVGLSDPWRLSGLYQGTPVPLESVWETGRMPPRIWLFRRPLLAEMHARQLSLEDIVRHVVIHEAGHHFGFSDADMHTLEDRADN
ncbi:metallopeptidase family protein [Qipengyuania algicida]|nr:metallopeptidase family protein [Qipengyuania algicida]